MEWVLKACWLFLALIHAAPAAVLFAPHMTERLYGLPAEGTAGLLLVHRGALFLAVLAAALFAAFSPEARRVAALVVGISVVGFLVVYARMGLPEGALRTVALVDAAALLPLAMVAWSAWRP